MEWQDPVKKGKCMIQRCHFAKLKWPPVYYAELFLTEISKDPSDSTYAIFVLLASVASMLLKQNMFCFLFRTPPRQVTGIGWTARQECGLRSHYGCRNRGELTTPKSPHIGVISGAQV
jgi:hypothetical protein